MTVLQRWVHRPQSVWLRKAIFQVHLWTGIGVGLYVLVASVTGGAVVFRRALNRSLIPPTLVVVTGPRLTTEALTDAAKKAYGAAEPEEVKLVVWLVELHDDLLGGRTRPPLQEIPAAPF